MADKIVKIKIKGTTVKAKISARGPIGGLNSTTVQSFVDANMAQALAFAIIFKH